MSTFEPSPEAVRVAAREAGISTYEARAALTAAGPIMEVRELRDAATAAFKDKSIPGLQRTLIGTWLRARAAELEGKS